MYSNIRDLYGIQNVAFIELILLIFFGSDCIYWPHRLLPNSIPQSNIKHSPISGDNARSGVAFGTAGKVIAV